MRERLRSGIDVSALALTRAGTARYVVNLLAALQRLDELELRPFRFARTGRAAKVARDALWYPVALPLAARRERLDVLHCPTIRAPLRSPVPLVVTIHDVSPLRHPEAFNGWTRRYTALVLPRVARAAAAIVTASAFQRAEIVELLGAPAERVRVIPYGVGDPFTADGPAADGDYVLAVSTLEPRKNLPRLVDAFRRARLDGCELRVVGARGWGGVRLDSRDGVRWLGEVRDDELAALYRGARCAAYVSLYEGFGLPVLEAMACGTPVVVPRGAPYDEFADGTSVAVDPLDPGAIAAGLE
ncbi:MAG: glycosyltransferase family 4 protein, partial [Actinomycetota bacterium]|nr:glycosyltransferase family 4 protein [Actinomycetota bacterium]